MLSCVKPGDILVFHVLKPIDGVVAMYKIISEVFENHKDIWGKGSYPFRVKIELLSEFSRNKNGPIPLSSFFGKIDVEKGIRIEPFLKGVWITRISHKQYGRLKKLFQK